MDVLDQVRKVQKDQPTAMCCSKTCVHLADHQPGLIALMVWYDELCLAFSSSRDKLILRLPRTVTVWQIKRFIS